MYMSYMENSWYEHSLAHIIYQRVIRCTVTVSMVTYVLSTVILTLMELLQGHTHSVQLLVQ